MKRLVRLLVSLFLLYILAQIGFKFFSKGYETEYNINNDYEFHIKEKRIQNIKGEKNNYYFEITVKDTLFSIESYARLKNVEQVISDIKYFEDSNYQCIFPIAQNNQQFTDVICKRENKFYPYQTIKGTDSMLDEFVNNLTYYNQNNYMDSDEILKERNNASVYNNRIPKIYIALENYKGIYYSSPQMDLANIQIFNKDIYTKDISTFIKNYYLSADYEEEYEFHNFYLTDFRNGNKTTITSNKSISMYSYINGVVDNSVYLFDPSNKKQYEIDIKTKTVIEVGNEEIGVKYYNRGQWEEKNVYEAINNRLYFNYYTIDPNFNGISYTKVDKFGNEKSGYYYLYEDVGDGYNVYRANVQNQNSITYLFKTTNLNDVIYIDDYIFYKDGVYIKYYHDLTGSRKLIHCNEINFNTSIKFGVYKK